MPKWRDPWERFEEKFTPEPNSGCWLWIGGYQRYGYGAFGLGKKVVPAHRFSYELHVGPIPKGLHVCHKCDTPPCVNPGHLFLGTAKDNCQDMWRKGRANHAIGVDAAWAKLNDDQVRRIRALYETGEYSQRRLGDMYGVSHMTIQWVTSRKSWAHVDASEPPALGATSSTPVPA